MNGTTYGLDIAKRVFQLYWVDVRGVRYTTASLAGGVDGVFRAAGSGLIALEACGSAHWWRRKLMAMGHEVKLIHARFVRPFVQSNKTDAADAQAIWTAVSSRECVR